MKPKADSSDLIARVRAAARQEQFLDVVSAEEARARFLAHVTMAPIGEETVLLADALGRVLAHDVVAAVDAPPRTFPQGDCWQSGARHQSSAW